MFFSLYDCQDEIINGTLIQRKNCSECDGFCEFAILVFSFLLVFCCFDIFCRKKELKEIKDDPPAYY